MYDPTKPATEAIVERASQTFERAWIAERDDELRLNELLSDSHAVQIDGIGEKGLWHWRAGTLEAAAQDSMAMVLNDLAMDRARPYMVLDMISLPEDDSGAMLRIVDELSRICERRGAVLRAGETAVHEVTKPFDITGVAVGWADTPKPNRLQDGDVLIGLRSSGLHANGSTKMYELFGGEPNPELTEPTVLYDQALLAADQEFDLHGLMNITGGGFSKLKRIMDRDCHAFIDQPVTLQPQPIFHKAYRRGTTDQEMYERFNCGIGFVVGVPPREANLALDALAEHQAAVIGEVKANPGYCQPRVRVSSAFSEARPVL